MHFQIGRQKASCKLPRRQFLTGVVGMSCGMVFIPPQAQKSPTPRGERLLGLDVQAAEDGDYSRAFENAKRAGVQTVSLSFNWADLETAPQQYHTDILQIANSYYPPRQVKLCLTIRPVDTNGKHVPADLKTVPFGSPRMIARFNQLMDHVLAQLPAVTLASLAIGNEVDAVFQTDRQQWQQYQRFVAATGAYIKRKLPDLRIGVPTQFSGATGTTHDLVTSLNTVCDLVMVTYYPLHADFTVKPPSVVSEDMARLTRLYPGKKIALVEAGYPSSPECNGSEEQQAEFVHHLFQSWDTHAKQIVLISFSWLTDISPAAGEKFTRYYGVAHPAFKAYLRSLGLRTYAGTGKDKQAFPILVREARARHW